MLDNNYTTGFPRILLFEDTAAMAETYKQGIQDRGFIDVVLFSHTEDVVDAVKDAYTRPAIVVSDFYVGPLTPQEFLPMLRNLGISPPALIMSSNVQPEVLNDLTYRCNYAGFLPKGGSDDDFVARLCQRLAMIQTQARNAWRSYLLASEAKAFVCERSPKHLEVIRRFLRFEHVKKIEEAVGLSKSSIYDVIGPAQEHIEKNYPPERYNALLAAVDRRLKELS